MKIGFIGLGIMGSRMAAHLLDAGHELAVHNRTREKAHDLLEQGAVWAGTPAEAAEGAAVLLTMLAHPAAVEATAGGEGGFLDALSEGALWVDSSTVDPAFSRRMAQRATAHGVRPVDAPVAGSRDQAAAGELIFFAGGTEDDVAAVEPLLQTMGTRVVHVGAQGMGVSLKMVVNHLLGLSMAAFSEGILLGEALGFDRATLFDLLLGGPVAAPYLSRKRPRLESDDHVAEFPMEWMGKDLHLVATAGYEQGVPLPLANLSKEIYQSAVRRGRGRDDFAALLHALTDSDG